MPCYDSRDDVRVVYENGVNPQYKSEAERLAKRCNKLTNLLCQVGRARYNKTDIPVDVLKWWDEHCKLDRLRGEPW